MQTVPRYSVPPGAADSSIEEGRGGGRKFLIPLGYIS